MELRATTNQRMEQRLLPQMLQSIEILQLATADLLQLVSQQMETNEALELAPVAETAELSAQILDATSRAAEEWEVPAVRQTNDEVDGRRALLESQPAPVDELTSVVRLQASLRGLPQELCDAVGAIADHLDERGLLPMSLADVAASAALPLATAQRALDELRTMEPRGLGASTGVEAMLLQAKGDPDYVAIERLLTQHLEQLAANKWPDVARSMSLSLDELSELVERMRQLNPAPGGELRSSAEPTVTADVAAWLVDGELHVALAEDGVPQIAVSELYAQMAADKTVAKDVRERLRSQVREARELVDAIAQRQATLLRVTRAVFERQRDFLERGRAALRPLRMTELAGQLGLHPSTVSRAIAGKHVATAVGTLPLRDFCAGGSSDGSDAAGHARGAVAERIAALVESEDRARPLSDDSIVEQLAANGVEIARRTVAKLREELGIPSSYRRKKHGAKKS